jgi:predicted ATP-binding protein involved in virulence
MPVENNVPDAMYFKSLSLENVRAFGSRQTLEFAGEDGKASRWNLILEENGVGKTTLLQSLAVMRPVPTNPNADDTSPPQLSKAELSDYQNQEIRRFIRRGESRTATMTAVLEVDGAEVPPYCAEIKGNIGELEDAEFPPVDQVLHSKGPLVIFYGAGRHVGSRNQKAVAGRSDKDSLFSSAIDLYDAEEILEDLAFAAVNPLNIREKRWFEILKRAVARLLPDVEVEDIQVDGPRQEDRDLSGVLVHTPSGRTPLRDLSLGYQTMFAWTVDLAWRLIREFPGDPEPLFRSAIVLIDEVDLHLHPQWQRSVRRRLLEVFPKVQFIATTHSPITAQETLSEGGNVAVVRWVNGEAEIRNNPIPSIEWRYDQLLASDLFAGFSSDRSKKTEDILYERVALIRNSSRSREQEARLRELDEFVTLLPTASSPNAQSFEELMMNFARDLPSGVPR